MPDRSDPAPAASASGRRYRFVTTWRLGAPASAVWAVLRDELAYPGWWPGVEAVTVLDSSPFGSPSGSTRIRMRSRLPYHLQFEAVEREVREPSLIAFEARGDLAGSGRWDIDETPGAGETTVTYTREVVTTRWWMNVLAPLAEPVFAWNHHVSMRAAAHGLARRLEADLIAERDEPPVRVRDWVPALLLAVVLAGVGLLVARWRGRTGGQACPRCQPEALVRSMADRTSALSRAEVSMSALKDRSTLNSSTGRF